MNYPPQGPPPGGGLPPGGQYPGGSYFPPASNQQPYPPPPGPYGQPQKKRSSIPMVIGILMLVFGGLGLLVTLISLAGSSDPSPFMDGEFNDKWETIQSWETISKIVGLVIGIIHIIGGIQSVRYASSAPKLAMAYGWIAIAWQILSVILVYAWLKPMLDGIPMAGAVFGIAIVFGALIGVAWPIIVLSLMSRPAAKEACVN